MIRQVVAAAVSRAIGRLPPQAIGLRSHALPTEEQLDACVQALEDVVRGNARLATTHVVIGSSARPTHPPTGMITVLPCDEAAAEATRVRNLPHPAQVEAPRLLYFNSDSTPGEAGLAGLLELTSADVAQAFADQENLPELKALAESAARVVRARVLDASIQDLADYAKLAREQSEIHAAPLLGFVPGGATGTGAAVRAVAAFDALSGPRAVEALGAALAAIDGVPEDRRSDVEASLAARFGSTPSKKAGGLDSLRTLCDATLQHARGEDLDPQALCGLTAEIARALRAGLGVLDRLVGGAPNRGPEEDPPEVSSDRLFTDEEVLRLLGRGALAGTVRADEEEDEDYEKTAPRLAFEADGREITLRGAGRTALVRALFKHDRLDREFWLAGGALWVKNGDLSGEGLARLRAEHLTDVSKAAEAMKQRTAGLAPVMDAFLARRAELLSAVAHIGRTGTEEPSSPRGLWILEHAPLLVVAQLPNEVARYVEAYGELIEYVTDETPPDFVAWVTNLDLAFTTTNRSVEQACLLPMHPLRLAHAELWLTQQREPPPLPSTIGVYHGDPQALTAEGHDHVFARVRRGSPSDVGLGAGARDGLSAAWALLRPRELTGALQIELVDVLSPAAVVDALCDEAQNLLDADADAPGLHLDIRVAFSDAQRESEVRVPDVTVLSDDAREALAAARGTGVSLSLAVAPIPAGASSAHLAIQAVETPYVKLPDTSMVASVPVAEFVYRPSRTGNIALIDVRGFKPLERYNRLISDALQLSADARGLDPVDAGAQVGATLVRTLVARRGWPVAPGASYNILSHQEVDDHVVVTLLDREIFDAAVPAGLAELSAAAPGLDARQLVEGVVALQSCRTFIRKLIERGDRRDLRGALGVLRAFDAATRGRPNVLATSLDGAEGQRWVTAVARALDLDDEKRADLLFVHGDAELKRAENLCVAELKARETKGPFSDERLKALAHQAQLTASRLRACFAPPANTPDEALREAREALRRLLWMGAGAQRKAFLWREVLGDLDQRIARGETPEITVECWIVPEETWGVDRRDLDLPALSPDGTEAGGVERVTFHILQPTAPAPHAPAAPTAAAAPAPVPQPNNGSPEFASKSAGSSPAEAGPRESQGHEPSAHAPVNTSTPASLPLATPRPTPPKVGRPTGPSSEVTGTEDGIVVTLGELDNGQPARWLPNRTDLVYHFNVGITGTMGTGKTQLTKSILAQLLRQAPENPGGGPFGALIFDYKGDYIDSPKEPFATAINAKVLAPEGLPINPLHTARPKTRQEFVLMAQVFADTLRTIDPRIGSVQRNEIIRAVQGCYQAASIDENTPSTWGHAFPTMHHLYDHMVSNGLGKGTPQSIVHDVANLGVFSPEDPDVDLDAFFDGVHVLNLRPLGGTPTVIRAIICFFMNAFYDRMLHIGEATLEQRGGNSLRQLRRLVLVDEADDFMSLNLSSLKNIMQQGRSFGHGVILSTQFLHHFNKSDTPLRPLIGTWILHQMADLNVSDVKALLGVASRTEANEVAHKLTTLAQHTSLCLGLSNPGIKNRLTLVHDLAYKDLPKQ
ncbi:MAG TPA: hypothetical protein VGQ83_09060 [Polyangia bacterium]